MKKRTEPPTRKTWVDAAIAWAPAAVAWATTVGVGLQVLQKWLG